MPPLFGGSVACFSSSPSLGCAPVSQFCTAVVTGQYSQPTGCPSVTVTADCAVGSNCIPLETDEPTDQGAVIRCASITWLLPGHAPVESVKQVPSSYMPSWAPVTATPGGMELRSNCTADRHTPPPESVPTGM